MVYANWGRRAVAFLIDFLLVQPYFILGTILNSVIGGTGGESALYFCAGMGIWANFYNKCIRMGKTGQSWGKQIMGFDLLAEGTQRPMGTWRAFLREAAHTADMITLGIGFIFPIWDRKRQTLADKIMKTITINHGTARPSGTTVTSPAYAGAM